jgi:hypothetical protein
VGVISVVCFLMWWNLDEHLGYAELLLFELSAEPLVSFESQSTQRLQAVR